MGKFTQSPDNMFVAVEYINCSLHPHTAIYYGMITLILDTAFGKHVFGVHGHFLPFNTFKKTHTFNDSQTSGTGYWFY
jgi:hypothetical protein